MPVSLQLPDIDIAISEKPRSFLKRMARAGKTLGWFQNKTHFDTLGIKGLDVVNFKYLKESSHDEVGVQLIAQPDAPRRISVEVRAARWKPNPPTREIYCEAAETLVKPLLASYNRTYGKRIRLRIEKDGIPKLTRRTDTLFRRFANLANKTNLHPLDWKRFYIFVKESRVELSEDAIASLLMGEGFTAERANDLSRIYRHLWAFKHL